MITYDFLLPSCALAGTGDAHVSGSVGSDCSGMTGTGLRTMAGLLSSLPFFAPDVNWLCSSATFFFRSSSIGISTRTSSDFCDAGLG